MSTYGAWHRVTSVQSAVGPRVSRLGWARAQADTPRGILPDHMHSVAFWFEVLRRSRVRARRYHRGKRGIDRRRGITRELRIRRAVRASRIVREIRSLARKARLAGVE